MKYSLPKNGRNPHKLRVLYDLLETNLIDVSGPAKERKGRSGYTYGECKDEEILHRIFQIFQIVYLRDLSKSNLIAKQFARGIIMEKRKKKAVGWAEFAGTSNRNQRNKWMKKVMLCLRAIANITGSNDTDLYKAEDIDDIFYDPNTEVRKVSLQ